MSDGSFRASRPASEVLYSPGGAHPGRYLPIHSPLAAPPDTGLKLDRGSVLNSRPVNGVPCKFRTCYDLNFWPVEITGAEWKTPDRLQSQVREEVQKVHKHYRRDLVVYREERHPERT